jgi:competence protein ComEC
LFAVEYLAAHDGKLHLVFCNVGQGDAIFLKTPNGQQILIDAGPDEKVLDCLSDQMPFWDRTLELVIVTHPHADHFRGLIYVLDRYVTLSYATEKLGNKTAEYAFLVSKLKEKQISQKTIFAGSEYQTSDGVTIRVKSPTRSFIEETSPHGLVGEGEEFASLIIDGISDQRLERH